MKTLQGMIDTGSSGCLVHESVAVHCRAELLEDATAFMASVVRMFQLIARLPSAKQIQ